MTNMRKFAAALVLGLVLCLALFTTGASAHSAWRVGGFFHRVSASSVAVARDNDFFDRFGRFGRFGGLGLGLGFGGLGLGFGGCGFGCGFDNDFNGGAFAASHASVNHLFLNNWD